MRDDVVARFSHGMVRVVYAGESAITEVTGGRLSLSTNDARCANPLEVCAFTVNEVRLVTMHPFALAGRRFEGIVVGTTTPAFNQFQSFLGSTSVRALPFWVVGNVDGQRFAFFGAERDESYLTIADLRMGPEASSAVVVGHLEGTIDGRPAALDFNAWADTPFENRPPYLDPVAPEEVATSCVAEVVIDPGLTDVDGDVVATWVEMGGLGIGGGARPVVLPMGDHLMTVAAEDRYGALGTADVRVRVVSDGSIPFDAGSEIIAFDVPRDTSGVPFAVRATTRLSLAPGARVVSGPDGAAVASLGELSLGVGASTGEAWAVGDALLANRAHIRGALHAGGGVSASPSAVIDGAVVRDGPYTPFDTVRFLVPAASRGPDVRVAPGESASLAAGAHGAIELGPRARLALARGSHTASSLRVAPGAVIVVQSDASSPTVLRVDGPVSWHGSVVGSTGEPGLALVVTGDDPLRVHSAFEGWILAPSATVTLLPAASPHRGGVWARAVQVQPGVLIEHVPLQLAIDPDDLRAACAVTPRVTCVREDAAGGLTAVFGYTSLLPHLGVVVPRGPANRLEPPLVPSRDHQAFNPRGDDEAFEAPFTDEVRWVLGGRSAVATRESPRCP